MIKKQKNPQNERVEAIKKEMNSVLTECATRKEKYEEFLKYSLKCTKFSVNNRAILFAHLEDPVVKTYKQWKDMGVNVLSTDNPVYLLRPSKYEGFYRNGMWVPVKKATKTEKQEIENGVLRVHKGINYSWFKVFDIKDTDTSKEKVLEGENIKNLNLVKILNKNKMDFQSLLIDLKRKISQKASLMEFKETYEASVLYCCGLLLGFNPMVNDYNLFTASDVNDIKVFAKIKKMMDSVVKDSEAIVASYY